MQLAVTALSELVIDMHVISNEAWQCVSAGCEADRPAGKPRQTGKAHHAGSALERDDSAMEETLVCFAAMHS